MNATNPSSTGHRVSSKSITPKARHLKPVLCLFTDSVEPSGMGEHMLALALQLRDAYEILFVCPPSRSGTNFIERARAIGVKTPAIEVNNYTALCRALQMHQVDIMHCHAGIGWEGTKGVFAARDAGVPIVIRTEHLPYLLTDRDQRENHVRIVAACDLLIAVSEWARRSYIDAGVPGHKITVVRNGIQPLEAHSNRSQVRGSLGVGPDTKLVVTVGRLTEQKGHSYLLEAIPSIIEPQSLAHFVWIGEGDLEVELRQKAQRLGLSSRISFLGRRFDVAEILASSDIFVLPSLFEGLPLAALEAMYAGLPVVGTHVCGTSEVVRDGVTGRLVKSKESAALASAIIELLRQPELAAQWGANGRVVARRDFSAVRMARETAELYDMLLRDALPGKFDFTDMSFVS
ncbi:MAG: glycosyltransferase family 4 protein [Chloroflexi bacterium]|nr:glycosyltransferase family 4 protein [Chloroflexota bacterium]